LYALIGATFTTLPKVCPAFAECVADTPNVWNEALPAKSRHSTSTSPSASTAMSHPWPDVLPLIPMGREKVTPPSVERLNKIVVEGAAPTNFVQQT
jgi:hypothetical protein